MDPDQARDRLSAGYLVMLAGRIVHEVGALAAPPRRACACRPWASTPRSASAPPRTARPSPKSSRPRCSPSPPAITTTTAGPTGWSSRPIPSPRTHDRGRINRHDAAHRSPAASSTSSWVPGTPDEVWAAIATAAGISSWMMPTELRSAWAATVVFPHARRPRPRAGRSPGWEPDPSAPRVRGARLGHAGRPGGRRPRSRHWSPSSSSRRSPAGRASCASSAARSAPARTGSASRWRAWRFGWASDAGQPDRLPHPLPRPARHPDGRHDDGRRGGGGRLDVPPQRAGPPRGGDRPSRPAASRARSTAWATATPWCA